MLKAVIFDLDDTLCNTSQIIEEALQVTFAFHLDAFPGKTVDNLMDANWKVFNELFTDGKIPVPVAENIFWYKVFEALELKPSIKKIFEMDRMLKDEILKKIVLIAGAVELLEYLQNRKISVGVLSNAAFLEQLEKLNKLKISDYIDYVVTPDVCTVNKPDPKAFEYILNKLAVDPTEAIMVGDNPEADIGGARSYGIKTVWIRNHYYKGEKIECDLEIGDLFDLKQSLESGTI